jgi:hypothetical protein
VVLKLEGAIPATCVGETTGISLITSILKKSGLLNSCSLRHRTQSPDEQVGYQRQFKAKGSNPYKFSKYIAVYLQVTIKYNMYMQTKFTLFHDF